MVIQNSFQLSMILKVSVCLCKTRGIIFYSSNFQHLQRLEQQPSIKHIRQKKRQTQVFSHSTYPFSCLSPLYTEQNFSQFKPSSLKFWSLKGQCQEISYTIFSQKTLPFRKDICKFENCVTVYSQRVMTKRTVLDFGNPSILYFQNFAIV